MSHDPDYKVHTVDAAGEQTKETHDFRVDQLQDGLRVGLGQPHGAHLYIERAPALTRIFLVPSDEGDEAAYAEFHDATDEAEARLILTTAGGKILFDSTVDNRNTLPDS